MGAAMTRTVMPVCLFAASVARGDDGGWRDGITLIASERLRGELVDWFRPRAGAAHPGAHRYAPFPSQPLPGSTAVLQHAQLTLVVQDTRLEVDCAAGLGRGRKVPPGDVRLRRFRQLPGYPDYGRVPQAPARAAGPAGRGDARNPLTTNVGELSDRFRFASSNGESRLSKAQGGRLKQRCTNCPALPTSAPGSRTKPDRERRQRDAARRIGKDDLQDWGLLPTRDTLPCSRAGRRCPIGRRMQLLHPSGLREHDSGTV